MREMKDSGIDWIGKIPAGWKSLKLQYACDVITDYTASGSFADLAANVVYLDDEDYAMLVRTADLSAKRDMGRVFVNKHAYEYLHNSNLYGGEIILPNIGSVGCVYYYTPLYKYATLAPNAIMLRTTNNKFLYYLFQTKPAEEALNRLSNATTQAKFNKTQLRKMKVIITDEKTQKEITDFLDTKCSEIDTLSADIQSEIDTLEEYKRSVITEAVTKGLEKNVPMKDSGLPWVGEIPSHWELVRGKYCLKYLQKPVRQDDGVITCFRDGEVTLRSKRREEGFTMSDKEIGYQGIDEGDLVVHGMDGFAGAIGISDSRGKASPVLNVLDTEETKKYFMYYLRSMAYGDVFLALATGIRVRSCDLRWNKLAELSYPIPPKAEQDAIVAYIDDKLQRADEIIKEKQEQLEVLADYKKSVIYEYVTGKKEVIL